MKEIILFKFVCLTGPLLYHFADMPNELSIELCYEDIHQIAKDEVGFQFLVRIAYNEHFTTVVVLLLCKQEERRGVKSSYITNPHSMMQLTYNCVFSVARKQPPT